MSHSSHHHSPQSPLTRTENSSTTSHTTISLVQSKVFKSVWREKNQNQTIFFWSLSLSQFGSMHKQPMCQIGIYKKPKMNDNVWEGERKNGFFSILDTRVFEFSSACFSTRKDQSNRLRIFMRFDRFGRYWHCMCEFVCSCCGCANFKDFSPEKSWLIAAESVCVYLVYSDVVDCPLNWRSDNRNQ